MTEHVITITPMESDYNRYLSPASVLKHSLDCVLQDIRRDGCDRDVIYKHLGAVWMISRMRTYQYSQIKMWDVINFHTFPRVIENGRYIFYVEAFRNKELVLRFDAVFIPVDDAKRKTMPVDVIEPLWKTPPRQAVSKQLVRMDMECRYHPAGKQTVRYSDCDGNRHLTSPEYLALVCDELQFWGEEARLMKFVQIDFASEVMPGMEISFERGDRDGEKLLRGYKPDGKLAFSATCVF
jgi:acyl-ACP thioesterase